MSSHEFTKGHESGKFKYETAREAIGVVAMHEAEQTITQTPEISPERQATFVEKNPTGTYYVFCGDDRNLTDASAEALRSTEVENPDTALRYFGGVIGMARIVAVSAVAQHGPQILDSFQGSFLDFVKDQAQRLATAANIKAGVHSAADNEDSESQLNPASQKGIGCAYGAGAEVVTGLNAEESLVTLGHTEEQQLFGGGASLIDTIAGANQAVKERFSQGGQVSFNVDRAGLQALETPVAVLQGAHASVEQAVVAINFHADKVSNPRKANEAGVPFYNNDVTQVAELAMRANPELSLSPRVLLGAMDQDIRATREALASHEGKHAGDLRIERYGDAEAAVAYLETVK